MSIFGSCVPSPHPRELKILCFLEGRLFRGTEPSRLTRTREPRDPLFGPPPPRSAQSPQAASHTKTITHHSTRERLQSSARVQSSILPMRSKAGSVFLSSQIALRLVLAFAEPHSHTWTLRARPIFDLTLPTLRTQRVCIAMAPRVSHQHASSWHLPRNYKGAAESG